MRKVCFPLLLALASLAIASMYGPFAAALVRGDPADASGPLDVANVRLDQTGRDLRFEVGTRAGWYPSALARFPNMDNHNVRFMCLHLRRTGQTHTTQLCFGDPGVGRNSELGLSILSAHGAVLKHHAIRARVKRVDDHTISARVRPELAGLVSHRYRWRALSHWSGADCVEEPPPPEPGPAGAEGDPATDKCSDLVPNAGAGHFRLRPVQPVGCVDSGPSPVFNGPRDRKAVALTFDDGPSFYTRSVLSALENHNATGTFFQIGEQIPGEGRTLRAIMRAGSELADHSLHHEWMPERASIDETADRIEDATGFRPCLFRPPGGGFDSDVIEDARQLGMTTVIWDVDPTDWERPGSDAIVSRVVSTVQPGSIVLLHDGGGDRSQTVAAVPQIISNLRSRGYRLVTVSHLLGQRTIWGPVR